MTDKNKGMNQPAAGTPNNEPGQRGNKARPQQDEQVSYPRKKDQDSRQEEDQDLEDRQKDKLRSDQDGTDSDRRQNERNGGE